MGYMVDGENYQRMQQDEAWVTDQFRKAWQTQALVTEDQVKQLQEQQLNRIQELEAHVDALSKMYAMRYTLIEATGGEQKLLQEAQKAGALRLRPDGTREWAPEVTAKQGTT
jgi:hypothetical protein